MTKKAPTKATEDMLDMLSETTADNERDALLRDLCNRMAATVTTRAQQPVNEKEMLSIYALMAYTAHTQNVSQHLVQMMTEAEFGVNHITKLKHKDYDEAVRFLVDLRVDLKRN